MLSNFYLAFKNEPIFISTKIPKAILEHCDNDIPKDRFNVVIEKTEEGDEDAGRD